MKSVPFVKTITWLALCIGFLTAVYTWAFLPQSVRAAADYGTANAPIIVRHSETVHDLFAISRKVEVSGNVSDNLLAIDATVILQPGAHVDTLLAIGGHVERAQGATVQNALLFTPRDGIQKHIGLGISFVSFELVLKFVGSAILIVLSLVLSLLWKRWLYRPLQHLELSLRRSFAMGALINVGFAAAVVGFALTGSGLPIAILLILVNIVIGMIGIANTSVYAGRMILRQYQAEPAIWRSALIGSLVIVAGINFPLAGMLVFFVIWCVSTSSALALLNLNRTKR